MEDEKPRIRWTWRAFLFQALAVVGLPAYFAGTKILAQEFVIGALLMTPLVAWMLGVSITLFGQRGR